MEFDRDKQVEALSREIWQLMEVRAAELRQLGCNSGFIQGLWRDTLAHRLHEVRSFASTHLPKSDEANIHGLLLLDARRRTNDRHDKSRAR
jgi:hypothetical protein